MTAFIGGRLRPVTTDQPRLRTEDQQHMRFIGFGGCIFRSSGSHVKSVIYDGKVEDFTNTGKRLSRTIKLSMAMIM
jgi:hypothetical protein